MKWFLYIAIGLVSGIISGMGIGGGAILIPAITFISDMQQQQAQNVNLIYFIPTAIIALTSHFKNGNIEKGVLKKLILYGIIGAVAGSFIAINMKPDLLRKLFGGFLAVMGIYEFFKKGSKSTGKGDGTDERQ